MSVNHDRYSDKSMVMLLVLFVLVIAAISFIAPQQVDPVPGTLAPNPYTVAR